jgi:hypothetical protein
MVFSVTCEQVAAMTTINKFCQDTVLLETRAASEKIMQIKETGKTKKVCGEQNFKEGKPMTADWKPISVK